MLTVSVAYIVSLQVRKKAFIQAQNTYLERRVQKRTAALEESEARSKAILDNAADGIIIFDDNLRETALEYDVYGDFSDALGEYRRAGGNLLYFGNLLGTYPALTIDTLRKEFKSGTFEYDILCLDSMFTTGPLMYTSGMISGQDTLGGMIQAISTGPILPDLDIDSNFFWWNKDKHCVRCCCLT